MDERRDVTVLVFSFLHGFFIELPNFRSDDFAELSDDGFDGIEEVFIGSGFFFGGEGEVFQRSSGRVDGKVLINSHKEVNNTIKFEFSSVRLCDSGSAFHNQVDGFG